MINLDDRYHSYLHGSKRMRIDGVDEKVKGYGWRDDGKDIASRFPNNKVTNIKEIDDPLKDVAWTDWKPKRKEYV